MGPNDYFMEKVDNWDALTFERAVMLETEKIPFTMKVGKRGAMIGIKAPEELMSWGVAKIDRGVVRLASLLGCYELEVNGVREGDVLNLVCMGEKGASMSSKILLSKDWTVSVGRKRELQLQAVKRSGNILAFM